MTSYGRILIHEPARAALRKTRDLSLARQIVDELEARAWRLVDSAKLFLDTLHRAETAEITSGLHEATAELSRLARSASAIIRDRMDSRDTES